MKKQNLFTNSSALIGNRLTQSLTTFFVLAFIARTLGSSALGQYTLASSYYLVFMTLVSSGFKTLFTRELAQNPSESSTYLVSGTFLQFLFSVVGYMLMALVIYLMPYSSETSNICYVTGLAIIPFALSNIIEAIFQAQEKMHFIALCTIPIYIVRTLVMVMLLSLGYGVILVSLIFFISELIIFILEWGFVQRFVKLKWKISIDFMRESVVSVRTFLLIDGISVFRERIQIFILSLLGSDSLVGLFGAVLQLMQPSSIVSNSIVLASFPSMSKASSLEPAKKREMTEKTIEMLLFVSLPMFVGVLILGKDLLLFLYKDPSFADAAMILGIVSFGMITRSFNQPLSYTLVANRFERVNLLEVINGTIIGSLLSILLIERFQLNGAAVSTLFIKLLAFSIYLGGTYKLLFRIRLGRILARPLIVSALMLVVFFIANVVSLNFVSSLIVATIGYGLIMCTMLFLFKKTPRNTVT